MLQAQGTNITSFVFHNPEITEFPTLICFHYSQACSADGVLVLSNTPNLLVLSISCSGHWLLCHSHKHHQFSEFRMRDERIPHIDMLPLQSAKASEWHTRPIRCAESPGAIHSMIGSLVAVLQPQTSPIFGIQNARRENSPHKYAFTTVSQGQWIAYCTYSMR